MCTFYLESLCAPFIRNLMCTFSFGISRGPFIQNFMYESDVLLIFEIVCARCAFYSECYVYRTFYLECYVTLFVILCASFTCNVICALYLESYVQLFGICAPFIWNLMCDLELYVGPLFGILCVRFNSSF